MNDEPSGRWLMGRRAALVISIGLTLIAAPPRLVNLDYLSFHSDEETTAFPARSLAQGDGARFPSGMEYRRALPLTWINAASARLFGVDREISYRIPTAIFGILTVPLLFLFGRRFVGAPAGLVAALLLGLSEWHLAFSRQARMYVPLVFFFLAASYAIWVWEDRGRLKDLLIAALLTAAAIPFHTLAALLAVVAATPLAFTGRMRVAPHRVLAFSVITGLSAITYLRWEVTTSDWTQPPPAEVPQPADLADPFSLIPTVAAVTLAILGLVLGLWAARRSRPGDESSESWTATLNRYVAAPLAGAFACLAQMYAAILALLVFLIPHPLARGELLKRTAPALVTALLIALGWGGVLTLTSGAKPAAKAALEFPRPFPIEMVRQFPTLMLLFGAVCVWLAATRYRPRQLWLRASVLATLMMLAVIGWRAPWVATRFALPLYPFLLLAVAAGMIRGLMKLGVRIGVSSERIATAAAALIAATGLLSAHGVPQAIRVSMLEHGEPVNRTIHMNPFQPDHEAPGRFLKNTRRPGDVVIAEDPLEQTWYAGPVDYWFRSYKDGDVFLYYAADGWLRDVYTNTALLNDRPSLDSLLQAAAGRVWFVTSGETYDLRIHYLEVWQQSWLDSLEAVRSPAFSGRDSRTHVYCLNCGNDPP